MNEALRILRERPGFRRLWVGNLVSQLGDWVGWVAIAIFTLDAGAGMLDLALVFAAHNLPVALLAPVAGPLVDRVDRRKVLVGAALAMAALTAAMALAANGEALLLLQLLLVLRSAVMAFFTPAERATMPRVVRERELLVAGALDAGTWSVVFCFGMALGGFLAALGPTLALAIDTVSFVLAAALLARLPAMPPERREAVEAETIGTARASVAQDIREAFAHLRTHPELRRAVLAKTPVAIAGGASWIALHALLDAEYSGAAVAVSLGLMHAVRGIGTGVGPATAAWLVHRGLSRTKVWVGLYGVGLVAMALFPLSSAWAPLIATSLVWGAGIGANWVLSTEASQRLAPDRLQGRMASIDLFSFIVGQTAAIVGTAWLTDVVGEAAVSVVGVGVGAVLFVVLFWRRSTRAVEVAPASS